MKIVLITIISLISLSSHGQYYYLYGDKTFGGNLNEISTNIIVTNNNDLIISGHSSTDIDGDKIVSLCNPTLLNQVDLWLLKIDSSFDEIWQKDIGGDKYDGVVQINKSNTNDEILFSCQAYSDSSCDKSENNRNYPSTGRDYWVGVLDSNGTKLWDKTYGGISGDEWGSKMVKLVTNEYVVSGISNAAIDGDKSINNYGFRDLWLVKMDSVGNKMWDNVYGGIDEEIAGAGYFVGEYDILANNDGTFILAGTTFSPISGSISDSSRGGYDFWIIKIDTAGNKIWDNRFGGDQNDYLYDINSTVDGGFVLCGFTSSTQSGEVSQPSQGFRDFWVVKVDSLGNKIWDKRFGGMGAETAGHIEQDFDGGYWVGGKVTSGISGDVTEPVYGTTDYWILKIDSLGNKIWDKRFGGPGDNILTSFAILSDSSIMLFGYADTGISSVKTDFGKGESDYWLVHFYYGNNPPVGISENINSQSISIYPNPATTEISIAFTSTERKIITISDISGKQIGQYSAQESTFIDISHFASGVYICKVSDGNNGTYVGKFLKY